MSVEKMEDNRECEVCGGPLIKMGSLGWNCFFRCRDCGSEFRINLKNKENDNEDTGNTERF